LKAIVRLLEKLNNPLLLRIRFLFKIPTMDPVPAPEGIADSG